MTEIDESVVADIFQRLVAEYTKRNGEAPGMGIQLTLHNSVGRVLAGDEYTMGRGKIIFAKKKPFVEKEESIFD